MICKLLTTKISNDRLKDALVHLANHHFYPEVVFALDRHDPKISFNATMKHIMETTNNELILFEDDVLLKDTSHFKDAIAQLPDDWELCYLGGNIVAPIERYSSHLFKTFGAWTTHAVMYRHPKTIGQAYTDINIMFDDWLKEHIHPKGNTYIISPMIAWQKVHRSELWGHIADYTQIFNDSANKLL